jgi:hypothetical protein
LAAVDAHHVSLEERTTNAKEGGSFLSACPVAGAALGSRPTGHWMFGYLRTVIWSCTCVVPTAVLEALATASFCSAVSTSPWSVTTPPSSVI